MEIKVPYGRSAESLKCDMPYQVLEPVEPETLDEVDILSKALSEPVGSAPFSDFIVNAKRILVIVTDATRPTPTNLVLRTIWRDLAKCPDIRFMVATGTHRPPTGPEYSIIFGDHYNEVKGRIMDHDSNDEGQMTYLGRTSRETEVYFNREIEKADSIITINNVKPHYFAGFTGGRKSFLPGISSYRTIEMNHSHATSDNALPMALKGNPVSEDMDEAARLVDKKIFSIQTVVTREKELQFAVTGDLFTSFDAAATMARKLYSVALERKGNIVISANTHPTDINLYQAQHAIENGRLALEDDGILILVSKCWEGTGNEAFLKAFDDVNNYHEALKVLRKGYALGYHKVSRIMKMKEHVKLWAVTDLDENTIIRAKMRPFRSTQDALDKAIDVIEHQGKEPRVIVMPVGGATVPSFDGA